MIKNWIRFCIFSSIFILLFSWLNVTLGYANDAWKDFYKLPHNSIDVVFLGNSHNFVTFQPKMIDEIVPIDSYVIGISGENIFVSYFELREILRYQKPKMVILETFSVELADLKMPVFIFEFTDSKLVNDNRLAVFSKFFSLDELSLYFPIFRTGVDWSHPRDIFSSLTYSFAKDSLKVDPNLGYSPYTPVLLQEEYEAAINLTGKASNYSLDENISYLNKLVDLYKKNDIQLVLSVAPKYVVPGGQFDYYVPFDVSSYAKEHKNIQTITFDPQQFNELHYGDPTHVNTFGSVITSIETALNISREMELPVNEEKLKYYRSFIFNSYSISHTGNEFTLELILENEDAPLEYKYTVFDTVGSTILFSSDWQPDNQYHFSLPVLGDYSVKTEIRNSVGDYSMTGEFRINYMEQ